MWDDLILFPDQASTIAGNVDRLFFVLIGLSLLFAIPIALLLVFFAIRYRRGSAANRTGASHGSLKVEVVWAVVPFLLGMGVFGWGARVYFDMYQLPSRGMDVYAVGKQWMWKFQHPTGQSEINELHVPINEPVRLTMISQDVIHSFYVPAFRIKRDVLPHRYTTVWFEATQPGEYRLFCAEYCGTLHSGMVGAVIAMEPRLYQEWLSAQATDAQSGAGPAEPAAGTMAATGAALFTDLECITCHRMDGSGTGPTLVDLYGSEVELEGGETLTADLDYIRRSILDPHAQIVAGYSPLMPTYAGQIDEEQLLQLAEYIRFLGNAEGETAPDAGQNEERQSNETEIEAGQEAGDVEEGSGTETQSDDPGNSE